MFMVAMHISGLALTIDSIFSADSSTCGFARQASSGARQHGAQRRRSHIPIEIRREKRAIIPAKARGIVKIIARWRMAKPSERGSISRLCRRACGVQLLAPLGGFVGL